MDRNSGTIIYIVAFVVALRKESVDRNCNYFRVRQNEWVALRKESVDRNDVMLLLQISLMRSLSARRAWIEIRGGYITKIDKGVALRKESVDRNFLPLSSSPRLASRSPQGERG